MRVRDAAVGFQAGAEVTGEVMRLRQGAQVGKEYASFRSASEVQNKVDIILCVCLSSVHVCVCTWIYVA